MTSSGSSTHLEQGALLWRTPRRICCRAARVVSSAMAVSLRTEPRAPVRGSCGPGARCAVLRLGVRSVVVRATEGLTDDAIEGAA